MTDADAKENKTAAAPGIQVVAQYIKDLSFENPNAPECLVGKWPQPETAVQISLRHQHVGDGAYECAVHMRVEAKRKDDQRTAFILDISYGALVALHNIPKENHSPVLMVEVPKLLFPFIREIVADATTKGGYPPLFLSPVNFEALYISEVKRQQAEKSKQASA
jgi:preprotein translocase subunit SecB